MDVYKFPKLAYNIISILGAVIAGISLLIMTFLYVIGLFASRTNPYLGVFLYMVMPAFLILGLILIPIGMYRTWRHFRRTGEEKYPTWPYIDLNIKSHRNAFFIFFFGTFFFLGITAVGSYRAYHYSESVTFCGRLCHGVMKPEYTAYQNSPHARVACVECHVGPGADWYAKSKLSGAYQVYATLANKYPRPIPIPIKNLRPARETCEQCHWPEKFFGAQQKITHHYRYDDSNSVWPINMLLRVDGGRPQKGKITGIHWHVNSTIQIDYFARDEARQDIPWIRTIDLETGDTVIYQDQDNPVDADSLSETKLRRMDCVDCHNRPSHIYNSPDLAVDQRLWNGKIASSLPEVKRLAVELIADDYASEEEAMNTFQVKIDSFYQKSYPDLYKNQHDLITRSIEGVQNAFSQNIFPNMKVRWSEYPNNIGHFYFKGCFRCHQGNHVSSEGKAITSDCTSCHHILAQGSGERAAMATTADGLEFDHPEDIDGAWQEMGCFECHTGTQP